MITITPFINIIIALLGLAYPILLQVVARLDEKYESENISNLFKTEWEWKAFKYSLVASLLSVLIWSFKLEPFIDIDSINYFIENSATLLIALSTTILVISFFFFVGKILKYYTPYSIIPYLIYKHEKSKDKVKYFPALSDLLLLSIRKQQTNLSRTLSDFFSTTFRDVRKQTIDKPVEYPDQYYITVYNAIEELAIIKEKRNYLLEHRTSGAVWLLGDLKDKKISEKTYIWLWRNLLLAVRYNQDDLIVIHWETCYRYYRNSLPSIHEKHVNTYKNIKVENQTDVEIRVAEREKFLEFHYALGGLLKYEKRYECIYRLFNYTQSQPPKYELLPEFMQDIFSFFSEIRDPHEKNYTWISSQYGFPRLSGISADYLIKEWIMSYMTILFLRQYTLSGIRALDYPQIPNTQEEINQWIEGLDLFKKLLEENLENEKLLKDLNLEFITSEWCDKNSKPHPTLFVDTLKDSLKNAYEINAVNLPLCKGKTEQFKSSSNKILESTFKEMKPFINSEIIPNDEYDKWYLNSESHLFSKDAFSHKPEAHHFEFDSFLATKVAENLKNKLGTIFLSKTTKSYLFNPEDLFNAVERLKLDKSHIIINLGIDLKYFIEQIKVPRLSIEKYSLEKISDFYNLYCSILDMNKVSNEIFSENKGNKSENELRKSALINIYFSIEFKLKKDIEIIQLKQNLEFGEQDIVNNLDEILSLKK